MHHFFVWFNKNRVPTEDTVMTKIGSCLRCLKGHTANKWSCVDFTPHSLPGFLSAPLCTTGCVRPFPLPKWCLWKVWSSHSVWVALSQSGAWEMMGSVHALNHSQGHGEAVGPGFDLRPWHLLPRCWWLSSPGGPTRWVANPDLLQDHLSEGGKSSASFFDIFLIYC